MKPSELVSDRNRARTKAFSAQNEHRFFSARSARSSCYIAFCSFVSRQLSSMSTHLNGKN